jgi:RNA-directed DNA polymerase
MSLFSEIPYSQNLQNAYCDLVRKFDEEGKTRFYSGVDGMTLRDVDLCSADFLHTIQKEMVELRPIDPVLEMKIPKRGGGKRSIYVYTLKDRIKAQAIYRIVEPMFEEQFSDFLFSYRSSHPHYKAVQSVARRYKKYYGEDTVLISDFSSYTDNIDREVLKTKLSEMGFEDDVLGLMSLFIDNVLLKDGKVIDSGIGVLTGVPLVTLFANFYLNDFDYLLGKRVALYRRVGDDFVVFDKDAQRVEAAKQFVLEQAKALKLTLKEEKTSLIPSDESFSFLGHEFKDGRISILPATLRKCQIRWKKLLKYYPVGEKEKMRRLDGLLYGNSESIHYEFLQLIGTYRQVTDVGQIKSLSDEFFRLLTRYFFGKYSLRNQRLLKEVLANRKVPSLYCYYLDFHNGKHSLASLALSA